MAVTEEGRVVGMLWRTQLLESIANGIGGRTVGDVMDQWLYAADVNDSVFDVQLRMNQSNRWAVPVTEGGRYRGIFTADRFVSPLSPDCRLARRQLDVAAGMAGGDFRNTISGSITGVAGAASDNGLHLTEVSRPRYSTIWGTIPRFMEAI